MDEMRDVGDFRAETPESSQRSLLAARNRLVDEARGGRGWFSRVPFPRRAATRMATAGGLSVVLAAGLFVTQTVSFGGGSDGGGLPSASARADAILHKAAAAARSEPIPTVGDGDFTYVESRTVDNIKKVSTSGKGNVPIGEAVTHREWKSVDGSQRGLMRVRSASESAWTSSPIVRNADERSDLGHVELGIAKKVTHEYLKSLPSDPDKLLARFRQVCGDLPSTKCDWANHSFGRVSAILAFRVVPPEVRAGLLEAMADIPGVKVVENATLPATGEKGVAITRTTADGVLRQEVVFDPDSHELLGLRTVLVKKHRFVEDGPTYDKGTVTSSVEVVDKALVGKVGQRP